MSIFNVSTTSQLTAALATAKSGDSIFVASGSYSNINLKNINPLGNVLITSADPQHQAVLNDMVVSNSRNLTFSGLTLHTTGNSGITPFKVLSSANITLDHLNVSGPALGSAAEVSGLMIRMSTGITVKNSEFSNLRHGIELLDNSQIVIRGNFLHDIRTDGVHGGNDSNVTIAQNLFTNFHPAVGDHPDAIQFWTTNTTASAHDFTITGNSIIRGAGDPIQGIFLRDQVGTLPFGNVSITNNLVVGGMYNGIFVNGATGVDISKNIVVAFPDQKSWIRTEGVSNLSVNANMSTAYVLPAPGVPAGNQLIQSAVDGGSSTLAFWLTNHQVPGNFSGTAAGLMSLLGLSGNTVPGLPGPVSPPGSSGTGTNDHIVTVTGTDGADRLYADATFISKVSGGAGADTLTGNGTGSTLHGGAGDDNFIIKGAGDIVVELAGEGNDTVIAYSNYTLTANVETLRLAGDAHVGNGNDLANRMVGAGGDDVLHGLGGDDFIQGAAGADVIYGDDGNDDLRADAGADQLWGGAGNDILSGGDGADTLNGGAGNDVIEGGAGNDHLWGGAGSDIFRFRDEVVVAHDADEIFDFSRGSDVIDLRSIDAKVGGTSNDSFSLIGSQAFHHVAGELQIKTYGDGVKISGDVNGDGVADFSILVHGVSALSAGDLYL